MLEKGSRPDNIYRFVEHIVVSKRQSDEPMVYNIQVIQQIKSQLNKCSEQINELHAECSHLKQQFNQLRSTKLALHDITNENQSLKRKCEFTTLKVDNRTLIAARKRVPKVAERAKPELLYYSIHLTCVFGGKKYKKKHRC